jgi:hypothetical protein
MLPLLEAEAKERQREAGKLYGENHPKQEVMQLVAQPLEKQKPSIEIAANLVGANKEYVRRIKRIAEVASEKIAEIQAGTPSQEITRSPRAVTRAAIPPCSHDNQPTWIRDSINLDELTI